MKHLRLLGPAMLIVAGVFAAHSHSQEANKVSYDREVQKILAEACFKCHGPDPGTRVSDMRLDLADSAYAKLSSGRQAIAPGRPEDSEVLRRIKLASDHDDHMPPAFTNKKLTREQIEKIELWIKQGAVYEQHWSFVAPTRPPVPEAPKGANPIDAFVDQKLRENGLTPNGRADYATLARRIALDLTGLPAAASEVPKDDSGLMKFIDRQLASPHYGERMALGWLDLARYADTHGYHIDSERHMWPWRDWVINAYNQNMPYDQFITEQLAGDLLPNATTAQKVATGFNRNHPITYEGGAIPEEYMVAYSADRVDATSTAMLGLTMRCASCHDHKYEPISQKDYFRFFAYFNNIDEIGLDGQYGNAKPFMRAGTPADEAKLASLKAKAEAGAKALEARLAANVSKAASLKLGDAGLAPPESGLLARYSLRGDSKGSVPRPVIPASAEKVEGLTEPTYSVNGMDRIDLGSVADFEGDQPFSYGAWFKPTEGNGAAMAKMDAGNDFRGWDLFMDGGRPMVHLISKWPSNCIKVIASQTVKLNEWSHVFVTYDGSKKAGGVQIYINGQPVSHTIERDVLTGSIRTEKTATLGGRTGGNGWKGGIDSAMIYQRALNSIEVQKIAFPGAAKPILETPAAKRTEAQKRDLSRMWSAIFDRQYPALLAKMEGTAKEARDFEAAIPTVMVMQELEKPRKTFFLDRGEYDKPTFEVEPGLPSMFMPEGKAEEKPERRQNRLDLARWLTSPENPLVARVAVNRLWQHFFGVGLVKTSENLGVQGEYPTHPELLDWLAQEYIAMKWDTKKMIRLIVTSQAYQRSTRATEKMLKLDPENRLLARGSRLRLPAEIMRDQALAVSGLLVKKIGGPSVRPYQPKGLWEEMAIDPDAGNSNFTAQSYVQDTGEKLYRRGMYTFWKRTVPPPMMQVLDAPEREFCIVRRPPTNTPLQALVTMNETSYVEAARNLAQKLMKSKAKSDADRVNGAFQTVLLRKASPEESQALTSLLNSRLKAFEKTPSQAEKLLKVGESPFDKSLDPVKLAAWTVVCNAILNMDEALVRP